MWDSMIALQIYICRLETKETVSSGFLSVLQRRTPAEMQMELRWVCGPGDRFSNRIQTSIWGVLTQAPSWGKSLAQGFVVHET